MAIYHLRIKMISRGKGQSGVSALAYRSGTSLEDCRTNVQHDYQTKRVEHVEFILPENAPKWIRDLAEEVKRDRAGTLQKLSDILESHEKRSDSQIYREFEFALPRELSDEKNIELANKWIREKCASLGVMAINCFHFDVDAKTGEKKPHCHSLSVTRELTETGFAAKKRRDLNRKTQHENWRESWRDYLNESLKLAGLATRVDHRSYAERGIEIEPQVKRGKGVLKRVEQGVESFKQRLFEDISRRNLFRIQQRPELVLELATKDQSTFTGADIVQIIGRYANSQSVFESLKERVMQSRELVSLKGKDVYTTRSMIKLEADLIERGERLNLNRSHGVHPTILNNAKQDGNQKLAEFGGLSREQSMAIDHILEKGQLKALVGYAGSGKTTSLEVAKRAWEEGGYKVLGLAPTGRAAQNLQGIGMRSLTVDKYLKSYERGRERYSQNSVFVLDEAGMLDSRRMRSLLSVVEDLGVKLVVVGDGAQLQAVQAGPAFRVLLDKLEPAKLESIVRQRQDWQKDVTKLFGQEKTRLALELYRDRGHMTFVEEKLPGLTQETDELLKSYSMSRRMAGNLWYKIRHDLELAGEQGEDLFKKASSHRDFGIFKTWKSLRDQAETQLKAKEVKPEAVAIDLRESAKQQMVMDWWKDREAHPQKTHIMLAYSNKDVDDLNQNARVLLREKGEVVPQDVPLAIATDEEIGFDRKGNTKTERRYQRVKFAVGDQMLFKRNDYGLGVRNGDLGTITELNSQKVKVKLQGHEEREVSFAPKLYPYIKHGWAITIHASQGATVDNVKKLASFEEYRNIAHVGMTRHRDNFQLYASTLEFASSEILIDRLSRSQEKLATVDYVNSEQLQQILAEDDKLLTKAEQTLTRVKDTVQATSHFVKGLFKDREALDIAPDFSNRSEAERAIHVLGLGHKTPEELDVEISGHIVSIQQEKQAYMPKGRYYYDLETLQQLLSTQGEQLVTHLLGQSPNKSISTPKEIRYGNRGSLVLSQHGHSAGKWYDFETGEGGSLLGLIEREQGITTFKEQLRYVAEFYGVMGQRRPESVIKQTQQNPSTPSHLETDRDHKRRAYVQQVLKDSQPLQGTLAEQYLREHREITGHLPESLRFYESKRGPALVSFVHNHRNILTGMQMTYLDPKTGNKADLDIQKRSFGKIKESTVLIQSGNSTALDKEIDPSSNTLYVAEGVETALSLMRSVPKQATVCAVLGVQNFANLQVVRGQHVVLCLDHDPDGSASKKAITAAITALEKRGAVVHQIQPTQVGQDFNDVLKVQGRAEVQKIVTSVQEQVCQKVLSDYFTPQEIVQLREKAPIDASVQWIEKLQERLERGDLEPKHRIQTENKLDKICEAIKDSGLDQKLRQTHPEIFEKIAPQLELKKDFDLSL